MRYIINDDDFEKWIEILERENNNLAHPNISIQYVIDEMKLELYEIPKKE